MKSDEVHGCSFPTQVTRKRRYTATGVYGTVSWLVGSQNRRLVVMWSAPFNFNFYSNQLAVGMTSEGVVDHPANGCWFRQMYYGYDSHKLNFVRHKYTDDISAVIFKYLISFSESLFIPSFNTTIRI